MSPPKRASLAMEAVLEKVGLGLIDLAKSSDEMARKYARPNYGAFADEDEPDAYDLMMGAPEITDFEPCSTACESQCPCHYKPPEDP